MDNCTKEGDPKCSEDRYAEVNLVRLPAGLTNFRNNHICVNVAINIRMAFDTNKAVLLAVVQPVASPPCSDNALQLICLHPYYLFHSLIAP
jgi:hypothetical protein